MDANMFIKTSFAKLTQLNLVSLNLKYQASAGHSLKCYYSHTKLWLLFSICLTNVTLVVKFLEGLLISQDIVGNVSP
jgi:hypothetical protein